MDMALVLGPDDPVVQASVDDARAILERLGARAFSARLDELMGGSSVVRSEDLALDDELQKPRPEPFRRSWIRSTVSYPRDQRQDRGSGS